MASGRELDLFTSWAIGSGIDAIVAAGARKLQLKRLHKLLDELEELGVQVTEEQVKSDDTMHVLLRTIDVATCAARGEKTRLLARMLGEYLEQGVIKTVDEYEEMLSLVDDLSWRELHVIVILRQEEVKLERVGAESPWRTEDWNRFIARVEDETGVSVDHLPGFLTRLSRTGLCKPVTGAYVSYVGGHYVTTPNLDSFMEMLEEHNGGTIGNGVDNERP